MVFTSGETVVDVEELVVAVCAWAIIGATPTVMAAHAARMAMERMGILLLRSDEADGIGRLLTTRRSKRLLAVAPLEPERFQEDRHRHHDRHGDIEIHQLAFEQPRGLTAFGIVEWRCCCAALTA